MAELQQLNVCLQGEYDDSYPLFIGENLFQDIVDHLRTEPIAARYAIITDSNVMPLYGNMLLDLMRSADIKTDMFVFAAGEKSKSIDTCMKLMGEMSKQKFGRDSAILALGGGVTGDMAGFMAAIFNRGIPYIQIPTTVIAQADSSIGGKTAINTEYGKNLVGAFKQPEVVYIDISTLATLPDRDYISGLAETIKHGIIFNSDFFGYLREDNQGIIERNPESLKWIARNNCLIKGMVVEQDPNEKGLRRILNYGHTTGHAIEKLSGFELLHGEAVSIGMMVAGRISNELGYFPQESLDAQLQILIDYNLPVNIPENISNEDIIRLTMTDKKAMNGMARYALPNKIGRMMVFDKQFATYVEADVVRKALDATRKLN